MSTNSGKAPACEMASVVAMNVCGTVNTTSPGCTPQAIIAKRKASVPLLTAIEWLASQKAANASSNSSTIGPPTKPAVCKARRNTEVSSRSSSTCGVTKSRKGMLFGTLLRMDIGTFHSLFYVTQNLSWISGDDGVRWDIFRDDATSANNRILSDVGVGKN